MLEYESANITRYWTKSLSTKSFLFFYKTIWYANLHANFATVWGQEIVSLSVIQNVGNSRYQWMKNQFQLVDHYGFSNSQWHSHIHFKTCTLHRIDADLKMPIAHRCTLLRSVKKESLEVRCGRSETRSVHMELILLTTNHTCYLKTLHLNLR